ncbi:MAG TPA: VanZ family protein [Myxococcota bacterium]|nr:VanZ family protein [Myxococcota bacterium]
MLPLRFKWFWLLGGAALIAAVVLGVLAPASELPPLGFSDFTEHAAAYTVLTVWFAALYARSRWLLAALALFLLGVALEGLQDAMALGRTADSSDVAANSLGIALGLALARAGLGGWMQWVETRLSRS